MSPHLVLSQLAAVLLAWVPVTSVVAQDRPVRLPSPERFLGHQVGADYFLADYSQLVAYWTELAARSPRMQLRTIGTTGYGQRMVMGIISSPANLARIDELRDTSEALARGQVPAGELERAIESGRSVIWIDAGLHSTESIAAQNILELVWRMLSGDSDEVQRILDEVVLLVCPVNPDGMEMIAKAYMATKRVGGIPVLYQRFAGHDNNRDFYANNLVESRAVSEQLYRVWFPQVVYNHHQSAPRGTVIFTPPFRDPFNYSIDPLVIRGIELVSAHMNHRFASEDKPGVISRSGASYSTWWNGGLRTAAYFHNQVGILTEVFGSPNPTRIQQTNSRRLPYSDYPQPIASQEWHARQTVEYLQTANFAILDLASRYRREFLRNAWRMARNSIEHGSRDHWTPTPDLLAKAEAFADQQRRARSEGRSSDSRGGPRPARRGQNSDASAGAVSGGTDPWRDPALRDARLYVFPADARNFGDSTRLMRRLRRSGVEVERLLAPVIVDGRTIPAGSYVVRAAQAFRPHVRDMLEPQFHPDDRSSSSGQPVRPYDSAGWTLALQMGVDMVRVRDGLEARTEPVDAVEVPFSGGRVRGDAIGVHSFLVDPRDANVHAVINRLLAAGETVVRYERPMQADGRAWRPGLVAVRNREGTPGRLRVLASEFGTEFVGVQTPVEGRFKTLRPVRLGLFEPYGGHMPTGWTEWALREYGFQVTRVRGADIENGSGRLNLQFDALVFHTGLPSAPRDRNRAALRRGGRRPLPKDDLEKLAAALPPFEDWGDLAERRVSITRDKGVKRLWDFVERGGTLIALGAEASDLLSHGPYNEVTTAVMVDGQDENGRTRRRPARSSELFIPGSLLWTTIDDTKFVGWGLPKRITTVCRRGAPFLRVDDDESDAHDTMFFAVATYPTDTDLLASGWAIGVDRLAGYNPVVSAQRREGWFHLFGADVMYRGQPTQSFRLVFNAIQMAGAR